MKERSRLSIRNFLKSQLAWLVLAVLSAPAVGQSPAVAAPGSAGQELSTAIQELRAQVQELRTTVAEMKSEAAEYRAQSDELRRELESIRSNAVTPNPQAGTAAEANAMPASNTVLQKLASLDETTQLLESEIRSQYQTKVESASKYRLRLSGLVLLNLFSNRGYVDNLDFPTYAASANLYGTTEAFGGTLRQSEIGLEVFGPELAGAKTSGEVQFDFGGGFPAGALDGVNSGLVRLRTASMRLDWAHTSIVAGQDGLFISPQSPTSFATLVVPSLGYSGNLWAWTPQLRVEHRFDLSEGQSVLVQGGILDNLTGEPSYGTHRQLQAGESSGLPGFAARTAWNGTLKGRPLTLGVSGYYSRQNWGFDWNVDGWATATDWRIPLAPRMELSGEFYRGRAVGGIGGGIGQSVLFSGNPFDPLSNFRAVNSAGGWSQLKVLASPKLEFNGAFGIDNPFSADVHAFVSPIGYYPVVLSANRSAMANFIYHPRSDLLFSGEYRHLRTSEIGALNNADQVNLMMGVLF
jgi:hypothetical protein